MDLQLRKLLFIEECIRLNNEKIIAKLESVLRKESRKAFKEKLKPMSWAALQERLDISEQDIQAGKIHTQKEVEAHFKNKMSK